MFKLVDSSGVLLTQYFIGLCVCLVILAYVFLTSTILAVKGFEGMQSDMQIASVAPGKGGMQVRVPMSGMSHRDTQAISLGQGYAGFFGRPEPPIFYEIGDTELVRSDRTKEQFDQPPVVVVKKGIEGLDANRWSGLKEVFEGMDPLEKALAGR
jgi:hypothetical protein